MSAEDKGRDKGAVTISLLGREFRVGCPEGEEKQLLASVDYLNRKLKEVRDTGKVVGNERIAIMAALNIAHEHMSNSGKGNAGGPDAAFKRRIIAMQETLDTALAADQENLF
ncbi:MAG TPA: cell division protein ZapA [Burkholderiales bacterium]|nr:cell division protein ZapA [Burkholderiales bacterium]